MRFKIVHIIVFVLLTTTIRAQITSSVFESIADTEYGKNSLFIEAFGNGVIYSINYDRLLFTHNLSFVSMWVGCTYFPRDKMIWILFMWNRGTIFGLINLQTKR